MMLAPPAMSVDNPPHAPGEAAMNEPTTVDEPLFNPFSPDFIRDPYPYYKRLREQEPMHRSPIGPWVFSRYADCALVLRDRRFIQDFEPRLVAQFGPEIMQQPVLFSLA